MFRVEHCLNAEHNFLNTDHYSGQSLALEDPQACFRFGLEAIYKLEGATGVVQYQLAGGWVWENQ